MAQLIGGINSSGHLVPFSATDDGKLQVSSDSGGGTGGGGDASAANQTVVQAQPGADATLANAIQGVTNGKPVIISSPDLGAKTDAPAGSDNDASASLIANFKRLLARLTSLLGLFPSSLGAKASANSFSVAIASDQLATLVPLTSIGIDQAEPGTTNKVNIGNDGIIHIATTNAITTGDITAADIVSVGSTELYGQSSIVGNATANSFVTLAANGYNSLTIQVSGDWLGKLQFEVSFDSGTTWYLNNASALGAGKIANSTQQNGAFTSSITNATNVRVRAINTLNGTANIRLILGQAPSTAGEFNGLIIKPPILYLANVVTIAGDTPLIAAPTSGAINLTHLIVQNESANPTTAIVKNGSASLFRILMQNQGDGFSNFFTDDRPCSLDPSTALVLNLSGANAINYSLGYYVL